MRKYAFLPILMLFAMLSAAQSASFITELLDAKEVTAGQVCYIASGGMGTLNENDSTLDALNTLKTERIADGSWTEDKVLNYAQTAGVLIHLWRVRTMLFYRITKSGRYAFRQLKIDGVVPQNADPASRPNGADVLNLYTAGEDLYGKHSAKEDEG